MENYRLIIMQYFCGLECGEVGSGLNVNLTFLLMTNILLSFSAAIIALPSEPTKHGPLCRATRVDNYRFVLQIKFSRDRIL